MLASGFYLMDCMDGMAQFPDKFFELAIVDPPYGIGINNNMGRRKGDAPSGYKRVDWDSKAPPSEYFNELFRVSANQIIWGANYFQMPPTQCFVVWRKPHINELMSFSMCEYAWASYNKSSKEWVGASNEPGRIHPTQKPIALYKWLLTNFARPGDKILDTHVGSASSLIACHQLGFQYWGFELDTDYYKAASERLERAKAQVGLLDILPEEKPEQMRL